MQKADNDTEERPGPNDADGVGRIEQEQRDASESGELSIRSKLEGPDLEHIRMLHKHEDVNSGEQ